MDLRKFVQQVAVRAELHIAYVPFVEIDRLHIDAVRMTIGGLAPNGFEAHNFVAYRFVHA